MPHNFTLHLSDSGDLHHVIQLARGISFIACFQSFFFFKQVSIMVTFLFINCD